MEFVVFDDFRVADALSVNSGGTVNASVNITDALQMGTGTSIFSPADNTLTFGTNSNERVRITSDGNVGINTSTINNRLHIHSNANEQGILLTQSGDNYSAIISDANRSSTNQHLLALEGHWNGNTCCRDIAQSSGI